MTIDIFGDSFSDSSSKEQASDTWTDILENKYEFNLRNFSKYGTGAQWCIEKFMKLDDYGDFLLFCLPDMNRVAFDYLETPNDQAHALLIYNLMNEKKNYIFPPTLNDGVIDMSDRIFKDFESFYSSGLYRILNILFVTFILSKSIHYKKILIWPSSGLGYPFKFYNNQLKIPDNCFIVSKSMELISRFERMILSPNLTNKRSKYTEKDNTFSFGKDSRNCHLSYDNHVIFAKQINDFFTNDIEPKCSEFKVSILEKY